MILVIPPKKIVQLVVLEINPIRNMKVGIKWLKTDTNPKMSSSNLDSLRYFRASSNDAPNPTKGPPSIHKVVTLICVGRGVE